VRIESAAGNDALVLVERISGRDYETWLFVADSVLYEELIAPGGQPDSQMGQAIMPMQSLRIETVDDTPNSADNSAANNTEATSTDLTVTFVTVDGQACSMDFSLNASGVGDGR